MSGTTKKLPPLNPALEDGALYFTDNGRVLCTDHLGFSARITARDISGQKIERVTEEDVKEAKAQPGWEPECEECGRR